MGSNYGINGGIFDGHGVADGISIDSGRETRITNASIKNTQVGIHILHGANSGSSDSDICDVNIIGNDDPNSIGLLVEGYDNTFTNMRIAHVNTGVWLKTGGNSLKNIHPLYKYSDNKKYEDGAGSNRATTGAITAIVTNSAPASNSAKMSASISPTASHSGTQPKETHRQP